MAMACSLSEGPGSCDLRVVDSLLGSLNICFVGKSQSPTWRPRNMPLVLGLQLRSECGPLSVGSSRLVQSFPSLRNEAWVAGLLRVWWGNGDPGSKGHPACIRLPWEESLLRDPLQAGSSARWQWVGSPWDSQPQGGKGKRVTIPVALGTPGELLEWGGHLLSFWGMCSEEAIGPSLL